MRLQYQTQLLYSINVSILLQNLDVSDQPGNFPGLHHYQKKASRKRCKCFQLHRGLYLPEHQYDIV